MDTDTAPDYAAQLADTALDLRRVYAVPDARIDLVRTARTSPAAAQVLRAWAATFHPAITASGNASGQPTWGLDFDAPTDPDFSLSKLADALFDLNMAVGRPDRLYLMLTDHVPNADPYIYEMCWTIVGNAFVTRTHFIGGGTERLFRGRTHLALRYIRERRLATAHLEPVPVPAGARPGALAAAAATCATAQRDLEDAHQVTRRAERILSDLLTEADPRLVGYNVGFTGDLVLHLALRRGDDPERVEIAVERVMLGLNAFAYDLLLDPFRGHDGERDNIGIYTLRVHSAGGELEASIDLQRHYRRTEVHALAPLVQVLTYAIEHLWSRLEDGTEPDPFDVDDDES